MIAAGRGGRIVNVTSIHEHIPIKGAAPDCAAKAGLGVLTKVMALELAEHGILVDAVAPGQIAAAMTGVHHEDPHTIERPAIPLQRPGHSREVAYLIAHLCFEEATYTTGASLVIDGGLMLMAAVPTRRCLPSSRGRRPHRVRRGVSVAVDHPNRSRRVHATGMSREAARFQARSAFFGVGFTTGEAEQVVNHPVRRRVVLWLIMLGNVGIVTVLASLARRWPSRSASRPTRTGSSAPRPPPGDESLGAPASARSAHATSRAH